MTVSYTIPGSETVIKGTDYIRIRPQGNLPIQKRKTDFLGMKNVLPVVQFDMTKNGGKVNEPLSVHVTATGTTDADMDYLYYFWSWGDGSIGSGIDTYHNYLPTVNDQIITITLFVQDPFNTNVTATKTISIDMNGMPVVAVPQITQLIRTIVLSCATDGATIYYTTDGSDPTTASAVYTGPIEIPSTATAFTLKTRATKTDMVPSAIQSAAFTFGALPTNNLIGYWSFDDIATSDIVQDCSGNMNDGANQGATAKAGVFDSSAHFDGTSNIVIGTSGTVGVLQTIADLTISVFAQLDAATNDRLFKILSNKPNAGAETGYEFAYNSTSKTLSFITNPQDYCTSKAITIEDGNWHHIAFTLKETTCRFYIDR